jgi:hypothetical protein
MEIKMVEITMRQTLRRNEISPRLDGMAGSLMHVFFLDEESQFYIVYGVTLVRLSAVRQLKVLKPRNRHGGYANLTVMAGTLDETRFFDRSYSTKWRLSG